MCRQIEKSESLKEKNGILADILRSLKIGKNIYVSNESLQLLISFILLKNNSPKMIAQVKLVSKLYYELLQSSENANKFQIRINNLDCIPVLVFE